MPLIIAPELSGMGEGRDTKDQLNYPVHLPAQALIFLIMPLAAGSFQEDFVVSSEGITSELEVGAVTNFPPCPTKFSLCTAQEMGIIERKSLSM